MRQISDEEGEVELINSDYSTSRFPFTYSWWSAYGYKRHLTGNNMNDADNMELIDQGAAYAQCGMKIKADLLSGAAVVLFAYGLSGSGKTFTVFGPDAVDAPEAWFKHAEPQPLWGIFPRLAYELFQEKGDGWKISMKYFQNVVDTVRDLMSPNAEEQHYKNGMRKDPDGFTDIEWCSSRVITSWNDLREQFQKANARKAIAPTQFNPMSTRGHCIMVLEVEMPHPETEGVKQRGRVYVCDLAGTEPAGDIVYANYNKVNFDDGTFEYKFAGAHPDPKKTKELQEQGKKINLSLSEMAQFFMKMAEGVVKKTLKPGVSIPGCNSFFLCKYLKDTMLQARTYLFCAIRPEVEFLKYTFATLGFAKNASVVKLAPKKAGEVAASAGEKKLMAELEAMKQLVAQLQGSQGGNNADAAKMIAELQQKLMEKQSDLAKELAGESNAGAIDKQREQERLEYARRGISLAAYDGEGNTNPYFSNLDEDPFRSNRFMYILAKEETVFGSKCDIQPMSLSVVREHCRIMFDGQLISIVPGKGETFVNGKKLVGSAAVNINIYDRVVMGDQLMMLRWPSHEDGLGEPMSGDDAVTEFQEGLIASRSGNSGGSNEFEEEKKRMKEERDKWESEKKDKNAQRDEEEYQRAMAAVDNNILDLLPKTKEAKSIVDLLGRVTMSFDVILEKGADHIPKVKISVENSDPKQSILIDPQQFLPKLSLLKDEMMKLRGAIDGNREYQLPEQHDPLFLMFDNDFHLGTATHWPEYLIYNLETDESEKMQDIKNAAVPYNNIGLLEIFWKPLFGPNPEDENKAAKDIENEEDLLGKPWTYKLFVKQAVDLPIRCVMAYIEYDFNGETYMTEVADHSDSATFTPKFTYSHVHHVPKVSPEFLQFLKGSMEFRVHVTQFVERPKGDLEIIGTNNTVVVDSIKSGEAKGYDAVGGGTKRPKSDAELRCDKLSEALGQALEENSDLKEKIKALELRIAVLEGKSGDSGIKDKFNDAKLTDSIVNG